MTFGQQTGPPATARQTQRILELLAAAGHSDFRDARGPLGLTQRQAAGRFTRDEADELIAKLEGETGLFDGVAPPSTELADVPAEMLAAELQRRGWGVVQP